MASRRTDLALEAKELWEESAQETTKLHGVLAREEQVGNCSITHVEILDAEGEKALGKPKGNYVTLEMEELCNRGRSDYVQAAELVAEQLGKLLSIPKQGPVLVAGLGNRDITPDVIGPKTLESVLVTRHLIETVPEHFGSFRPVSAIATGVMGDTGVESGELIRAVVNAVKPACIIAVDALASRSTGRLFHTIQITDTGIVPGSGVGNHRMALTKDSMGIPVIAIGVPTVVDAATLCLDLLEKTGQKGLDPESILNMGSGMFVTPRDVDSFGQTMSKVLGLGISLALHVDLSVEDVEMFLS
ncbi:MAG: Endopeptidase spore protease Gpr [Evtepia sp.]|jgi:spore protease|nr:Endopeptidase spore protease Gpr [Evtepia sp.]